MKEMDELLCRLLYCQLQSIGLFKEKETPIAELKMKLDNLYHRWLEESIAVLARHNFLRFDGKFCTVIKSEPIDSSSIWKEWEQQKSLWLEDPSMGAEIRLIETTMRALPEVITGKRPATDVIFPNSSMELVEGIYKKNDIGDASKGMSHGVSFNEVLADAIIAYIEEWLTQDSSTQIRLIEIGAGTGGTSAAIFQKLKPYQAHIQEYCYTDISKAFLIHAKNEFGAQNPYLTYHLLNIELPLTGQGIDAGKYDLAIAADVLHATKNIRQTLRNTKATLKKNGLLILNEINGSSLFTHLTFGLLKGWWLYEDPALRIPGCPD